MAQVLVNFRLDEDDKRGMEAVCREIGLSMSTAFTIFAKKVRRERRIPFELSADSVSMPRTLDTMSAEELNAKLQHSYEQALNGDTLPFESVFADLKRGLKG